VHTFGKARLTSVAIRIRNRMQIRIRIQIQTPPKFNHLFKTLPTFPENFMQIRSEVFAQSC